MKKTMPTVLVTALLFALAPTSIFAADDEKATLKPGDAAPPLVIDKWVKGEPVKALEKGKVYVLECWATWCGPCVQAIPHVTELQKKYADKGLVVIGMNVWEHDASAVEPFVKKMGEKMEYRVATDSVPQGQREGKMATTWMKAAGKSGIPCSFIVDRAGKIAWIGHPMAMDKPLVAVLEGKFDPAKEAERQAKADALEKKFGSAMRAKKFDEALAAVDEIIAANPDQAAMYSPAKLMIYIEKKDFKAANALAKELSEGETGKDQRGLLTIAFMLLQGDPKQVDLDLALSVAEKASGMGGEMAPFAKAMMAKSHAGKGDYAKAVKLQTAAIEEIDGPQKAELENELKEYQAKLKEGEKSKDSK